jgi:hypothetical protein
VVVFLNGSGTQKGDFYGVPPTNKQMNIRSADLYRIENGLIIGHWDVVKQVDYSVKKKNETNIRFLGAQKIPNQKSYFHLTPSNTSTGALIDLVLIFAVGGYVLVL